MIFMIAKVAYCGPRLEYFITATFLEHILIYGTLPSLKFLREKSVLKVYRAVFSFDSLRFFQSFFWNLKKLALF